MISRYHLFNNTWCRRGRSNVDPGHFVDGGGINPELPKPRLQLGHLFATSEPAPVASGARFPGDPGPGKFYFGGREDQLTWSNSETAIANWETGMAPWSGGKKLGIIRVFSGGDVNLGFEQQHVTLCATHYSHGRLPHVSFKLAPGVSLSDCANQTGQFNTWMDNLAARFKSYAPKPIWWTFWHEPENDDATGNGNVANQAQFRAACRNMRRAMQARGVTNDAFMTTGYMDPYTFGDRGGTRDWRQWYPDWKGTTAAGSSKDAPNPIDFYLRGDPNAVVDGIALDVYSWWEEGDPTDYAAKTYESFRKLFGWAWDRTKFLGQPYAITEHGVLAIHTGVWNADPTKSTAVFDDARTLDYLSAMYDTIQDPQYRITALMVYNYALTETQYRLEMGDPHKTRYQGYGLGLTRSASVRPDEIGWI